MLLNDSLTVSLLNKAANSSGVIVSDNMKYVPRQIK